MNRSTWAAVTVVIVILFGLMMWSLLTRNPGSPQEEPNASSSQPAVSYVLHSLATSTPYASVSAEYPEFTAASVAFNAEVRDVLKQAIADHLKEAGDNWKARHDTDPSSTPEFPPNGQTLGFASRWELVQANDRYISFIMRFGGYTGGAHGYDKIRTFNYDVRSGKDVVLKDLFPNDSIYLITVSTFARSELEKHFADVGGTEFLDAARGMLEDGTSPLEDNFKNFTFTDKEITFYFEQYQVAPYSAGEQEVTMPRA